MSQELLSIIVPVYNTEKYIRTCIDSILNQVYENIEVILIDDGSTDSSGDICDEYAIKDKRIQVYHIKNSGPSQARNFGIRMIKGRYLAFVDADDLVRKNMYQQLIKIMNQENVQMAVGTWINHDLSKNKDYPAQLLYKGKLKAKELKKVIIADNVQCGGGYPWNRVIDYRYILEHSDNPVLFVNNLITYEDKCWILDICDVIEDVYITDYVCYDYYIRDTSLSHKETPERQFSIIAAWKYMLNNIEKDGSKSTKLIIKIFKQRYFHVMWNLRYDKGKQIYLLWQDYKKIRGCRDFHFKHMIKFAILDIVIRFNGEKK